MQIGSGQSALSLALFKALGNQPGTSSGASGAPGADAAAARAEAAKEVAAKEALAQAAGSPEAPGITTRVPAPVSDDSCSGSSCPPPRGSFVDIRA